MYDINLGPFGINSPGHPGCQTPTLQGPGRADGRGLMTFETYPAETSRDLNVSLGFQDCRNLIYIYIHIYIYVKDT